MTEIPADVMEAAENIVDRINFTVVDPATIRTDIANAIMEERERCARIAEQYDHSLYAAMGIRSEEC